MTTYKITRIINTNFKMNNLTYNNQFSDEDGNCLLPMYCDTEGTLLYEDRPWFDISFDEHEKCDLCDTDQGLIEEWYFAAVLRTTRSYVVKCMTYDDDGEPVIRDAPYAAQLGTEVAFNVCQKCKIHCDAHLNYISDHIAVGRDWWDMLEVACENMKRLKELPEWKATEAATIKVQAAWRGYLARNWPSNKHLCNLCQYKPVKKDKWWSSCMDCGSYRRRDDLLALEACADWNCCYKLVCKDACRFFCNECWALNVVDESRLNNDGEPNNISCYNCHERMELYSYWNGLTQAEMDRRYE